MRKIVVSEYLSLDGVMEEPSWTAPYWNDEIAKFKSEENLASNALLLGRITYEGFAVAWPKMEDDEGAFRMNSLPKYVVSTTLQEAAWNNSTIFKENIQFQIELLKQQPGQDILVYGSGKLAESLLQLGLVDQLNLLIYPVVLGKGKPFFRAGCQASLKLLETRSFSSGVVLLRYQA
jgi:dihydrofolate reductase